jgi:hypothetical protein
MMMTSFNKRRSGSYPIIADLDTDKWDVPLQRSEPNIIIILWC